MNLPYFQKSILLLMGIWIVLVWGSWKFCRQLHFCAYFWCPCVYISFSWWVKLLHLMVCVWLALIMSNNFPKWLYQFLHTSAIYNSLLLLYILVNTWYCLIFFFSLFFVILFDCILLLHLRFEFAFPRWLKKLDILHMIFVYSYMLTCEEICPFSPLGFLVLRNSFMFWI